MSSTLCGRFGRADIAAAGRDRRRLAVGSSKPRCTFHHIRNGLAGLPVSRRQANHLWRSEEAQNGSIWHACARAGQATWSMMTGGVRAGYRLAVADKAEFVSPTRIRLRERPLHRFTELVPALGVLVCGKRRHYRAGLSLLQRECRRLHVRKLLVALRRGPEHGKDAIFLVVDAGNGVHHHAEFDGHAAVRVVASRSATPCLAGVQACLKRLRCLPLWVFLSSLL